MFHSQWQKKDASWKDLDKIFFTWTGDAASERSIPIKIGWIVSNCGRSSGHTRNGLSGMVDGARMHSRLKTRHKWDALRPSFPLLLIGASIRNFPLKGSTIRAAISSDIHFQESWAYAYTITLEELIKELRDEKRRRWNFFNYNIYYNILQHLILQKMTENSVRG